MTTRARASLFICAKQYFIKRGDSLFFLVLSGDKLIIT